MINHSKPTILANDLNAVQRILTGGLIAEGELVTRLEDNFCDRYQAEAGIAVGSACQGLLLALKAIGICAKQEVILPTYVCPEVLGVVEYLEAKPVLVDIDLDYLISTHAVEQAVTSRTGAIIVPYLFGIWRNMSSLRALNIPIVEDCAQFIDNPDKRLANFIGDFTVFSFHATKLIAGGEGGLVLVNNPEYCRPLRAQKWFRNSVYKVNLYPMTDLQAALILSQLDSLPIFLERRQALAEDYFFAFEHMSAIELPWRIRDRSIFFRFPIRLNHSQNRDLDHLIARFGQFGVAVRRPMDKLLHRLCPDLSRNKFPVADQLFSDTFSIPLYPALTKTEVETIVAAGNAIFNDAVS